MVSGVVSPLQGFKAQLEVFFGAMEEGRADHILLCFSLFYTFTINLTIFQVSAHNCPPFWSYDTLYATISLYTSREMRSLNDEIVRVIYI